MSPIESGSISQILRVKVLLFRAESGIADGNRTVSPTTGRFEGATSPKEKDSKSQGEHFHHQAFPLALGQVRNEDDSARQRFSHISFAFVNGKDMQEKDERFGRSVYPGAFLNVRAIGDVGDQDSSGQETSIRHRLLVRVPIIPLFFIALLILHRPTNFSPMFSIDIHRYSKILLFALLNFLHT